MTQKNIKAKHEKIKSFTYCKSSMCLEMWVWIYILTNVLGSIKVRDYVTELPHVDTSVDLAAQRFPARSVDKVMYSC